MSTELLQPPPQAPKGPSARTAPSPRGPAARRPTLPAAHGEPMIWVMGAGLVLALAMVVGMLGLILAQGSVTFWQSPIDRVTLKSGQVFLGIPSKTDDEHARTLYRTGNLDSGGQPFRWVDNKDIASVDQPKSALLLERTAWGIWLGEPKAIVLQDDLLLSPQEAAQPAPSSVQTDFGPGRVERTPLGEESGKTKVRQRTYLAEDPAQARALLEKLRPLALDRTNRVEHLTKSSLGDINHDIEATRLNVRKAELKLEQSAQSRTPILPWWGVALALAAAAASAFSFARLGWSAVSNPSKSLQRRALRAGLRGLALAAAAALLLLAALENPASAIRISPQQLASIRASAAAHITDLEAQYAKVQSQIATIDQEDRRFRVLVVEPTTNHFAPITQSDPDEPMLVSQIVRMVSANDLSLGGKIAVYFSRWTEFLTANPREANTEGGVLPVIFGTVMLTLLLSILVVPLGVIAALYLREYAHQGLIVSIIRIAVNNLAGIPSIVYGVFGYGFFLITVGGYIDQGSAAPASTFSWWWGIIAIGLTVAFAVGLSTLARGMQTPKTRAKVRTLVGCTWLAAAALAIWSVASLPYFHGLYREKLPSPTFGTGGILWAALTLALLTLPVVIVATEEAIAAVPRSVREGSYGCGASKWQTVWRIVLPQALPGIMTGAILAMARGAGEVAPLMLVGAVKLAPELPVDGHFPFVHAERSFMHLGFHIYDLGFQSPNSEAARPLVWTTTLLLVFIVLALNLSAVVARARLRSRVISSSV